MAGSLPARRAGRSLAFWMVASSPAFGLSCAREASDALPAEGGLGLSREELMNPASCRGCHPVHYAEWAGSMHAYASTDPVFRAMNQRGQRETEGELGTFCVGCHAPLAVSERLTEDGLNLEQLPEYVQGVGCYSCHAVTEVTRLHNNGLRLSHDRVMRGGLEDPVPTAAHGVERSALHASSALESSDLCGACHDVVTPRGVHLERTYAEWKASLFGADQGTSQSGLSCNACHMPLGSGPAAVGGAPDRVLHGHQFAAVDLALTPFPETEDEAFSRASADQQRSLVQEMLDASLAVEICVQPLSAEASAVYVTLENASAGHNWPSGASQDRRAWVELLARDAEGAVLYQSGTGYQSGDSDPDLWLFRDHMKDESGDPVHAFWEAASVEAATIPAPVTSDPSSRDFLISHVTRRFPKDPQRTLSEIPATVSVLVRLTPIGREVLEDLVQSGDLAPRFVDRMPVFDLVPNRHLGSEPGFESLAEVTFEWSRATRESALFAQRTINEDAFPRQCVGTTLRR